MLQLLPVWTTFTPMKFIPGDNHSGIRLQAILAAALILFVFSRLLIVMSANESLVFLEEEFIGCSAKQAFSTPIHEMFNLQLTVYAGGTLAVTYLTAVCFNIFGSTMMVLKMVAVGIGGLNLIAWILIAGLLAGPRSSMVMGLMYVFAPPAFLQTGCILWGSHLEGQLFFSLAVLQGIRLLLDPSGKRIFSIFLIGFSLGFGIWFTFENAFLIPGMLIILWGLPAVNRRICNLASGLAGFIFGLVPWIVHNAMTDGAPVKWVFDKRNDLAFAQTVKALGDIFWKKWPASFGFQDFFENWGGVFNVLFGLMFLAASVAVIRQAFSRPGLPKGFNSSDPVSKAVRRVIVALILFAVILAISYARSKFAVVAHHGIHSAIYEYRYLVPLQTFMFFFVSLLFRSCPGKTGQPARILLVILLAVYLLINIMAFRGMISWSGLQTGFKERTWENDRVFFELQANPAKAPPKGRIEPPEKLLRSEGEDLHHQLLVPGAVPVLTPLPASD